MKCKYCGKEIDEGSMFCGYCGKQQPKVKYCTKCGQEIGLDDTFCGYCGTSQNIEGDTCDITNKNVTQLESQISTTPPKEERVEDNAQILTMNQDKNEDAASGEPVKEDIKSPPTDKAFSSLMKRPKTPKWIFIVIALLILIGCFLYFFIPKQKQFLSENEKKQVIETIQSLPENESKQALKTKQFLPENESKQVIKILASIINQYDDFATLHVSDGLIGVKKNGKCGFININGEEVISCKYDLVSDFSEGLAAVKDDKDFLKTMKI